MPGLDDNRTVHARGIGILRIREEGIWGVENFGVVAFVENKSKTENERFSFEFIPICNSSTFPLKGVSPCVYACNLRAIRLFRPEIWLDADKGVEVRFEFENEEEIFSAVKKCREGILFNSKDLSLSKIAAIAYTYEIPFNRRKSMFLEKLRQTPLSEYLEIVDRCKEEAKLRCADTYTISMGVCHVFKTLGQQWSCVGFGVMCFYNQEYRPADSARLMTLTAAQENYCTFALFNPLLNSDYNGIWHTLIYNKDFKSAQIQCQHSHLVMLRTETIKSSEENFGFYFVEATEAKIFYTALQNYKNGVTNELPGDSLFHRKDQNKEGEISSKEPQQFLSPLTNIVSLLLKFDKLAGTTPHLFKAEEIDRAHFTSEPRVLVPKTDSNSASSPSLKSNDSASAPKTAAKVPPSPAVTVLRFSTHLGASTTDTPRKTDASGKQERPPYQLPKINQRSINVVLKSRSSTLRQPQSSFSIESKIPLNREKAARMLPPRENQHSQSKGNFIPDDPLLSPTSASDPFRPAKTFPNTSTLKLNDTLTPNPTLVPRRSGSSIPDDSTLVPKKPSELGNHPPNPRRPPLPVKDNCPDVASGNSFFSRHSLDRMPQSLSTNLNKNAKGARFFSSEPNYMPSPPVLPLPAKDSLSEAKCDEKDSFGDNERTRVTASSLLPPPTRHPQARTDSFMGEINILEVFYPEDITTISYIQRGAQGSVELVSTKFYRRVALKKFDKRVTHWEDGAKRELRALLRGIFHQNIVRMTGILIASRNERDIPTGILMEYMEGGSVHGEIYDPESQYYRSTALHWCLQAASALHFLHSRDLIHRDVKPGNMLLSADREVLKISDFGLCTRALSQMTADIGTVIYMAPEVFSDSVPVKYNEKCDVHSLGVCLWEMIHRRTPYGGGDNVWFLMGEVRKGSRPEIEPEFCLPEITSLLQRMWAAKPTDRLNMEQVHDELKKMLEEKGFFEND